MRRIHLRSKSLTSHSGGHILANGIPSNFPIKGFILCCTLELAAAAMLGYAIYQFTSHNNIPVAVMFAVPGVALFTYCQWKILPYMKAARTKRE